MVKCAAVSSQQEQQDEVESVPVKEKRGCHGAALTLCFVEQHTLQVVVKWKFQHVDDRVA